MWENIPFFLPSIIYASRALFSHPAGVICGAASSLTSLLVVATEHFPSQAVTGANLMDRMRVWFSLAEAAAIESTQLRFLKLDILDRCSYILLNQIHDLLPCDIYRSIEYVFGLIMDGMISLAEEDSCKATDIIGMHVSNPSIFISHYGECSLLAIFAILLDEL